MPVVSVSLDSELYTRLVELARERGLSVGSYVKELIKEHLKGLTSGAGQTGLEFEARISNLEVKLMELEEIKARVAKLEELLARQPKVEPTVGNQAQKTKEGSEYVKTVSIEWASRKGLNLERYMKDKERQGYICNDTASHIICVWREELEQAVVDLNSAKARMGELGKVLSGVRLEVAKAAEKAGLLWFDAGEGKWKIQS